MLSSKALKVHEIIRDILHDPVEMQAIRHEMGECLLKLVRDDYILKSKGAVGAGGLQWDETKTGRDIMVDTGRLLDSLEVIDLPDGDVGVHFGIFPPQNDADYGRLIALQIRPAWPETLPEEWIVAVKNVLQQWLLSRLQRIPDIRAH